MPDRDKEEYLRKWAVEQAKDVLRGRMFEDIKSFLAEADRLFVYITKGGR